MRGDRVKSEDHTARVAIIGSGFGGLGTAIRLKQEGVENFMIFERAGDVGGTWRDNTYPGCACDVESHLYSFSFAPNPDWASSFSPQPEIWAYLQRCARDFGVLPHIRFHHEVRQACWDEAAQHWRIETSQGSYTASILVMAAGALSEPAMPRLPGLETFQGQAFHSARWDHDYDLTDRRVAVVGTGASAIQFVPEIQPQVAKLHLFQRTPPWIMPRSDRTLSEREHRLFRRFPVVQRAARSAIYLSREIFLLGFRHLWLAGQIERVARRHLERSVPDPQLRAKLLPDYAIGCKRILISNDYLPSLLRPNVELVTAGIAEIRAHSIVDCSGVERPVDAIIFGTGFRVTDQPLAKHIRGREGRTLSEVWAGSPQAHIGTTVAGFPNCFILLGPNTGLGHNSVVYMIEAQIEHLIAALSHMWRHGASAIEPRPEAQSAYVAEVQRRMEGTVWIAGGCASWYLDSTGRNSTIWPDFSWRFRRRVARLNTDEYVLSLPHHAQQPADFFQPTATRAANHSDVRATPSERVQGLVASALGRLPVWLQLRLSGQPQIVVDNQTLDPQLQLLLAIQRKRRRYGLCEPSPAEARVRFRRDILATVGRKTNVGTVRDFEIPGEDGTLRVRHYAPLADGCHQDLLVYLHGGGFVIGDLDTHDEPCRLICHHAETHVLSVDYRLAPEHPFPAALNDTLTALRWAQENAATLGADRSRVALGGDSAGGNLTAVAARLAAQSGFPPAAQLLIYPATDVPTPRASKQMFGEGFFITREDCAAFIHHYTNGTRVSDDDPRVSPLRATDHSGLPPALPPALVVTAGFDLLRDEGEAYAAALRETGTTALLRRFSALGHGFIHLTGISRAARQATIGIARDWQALLDSASS